MMGGESAAVGPKNSLSLSYLFLDRGSLHPHARIHTQGPQCGLVAPPQVSWSSLRSTAACCELGSIDQNRGPPPLASLRRSVHTSPCFSWFSFLAGWPHRLPFPPPPVSFYSKQSTAQWRRPVTTADRQPVLKVSSRRQHLAPAPEAKWPISILHRYPFDCRNRCLSAAFVEVKAIFLPNGEGKKTKQQK